MYGHGSNQSQGPAQGRKWNRLISRFTVSWSKSRLESLSTRSVSDTPRISAMNNPMVIEIDAILLIHLYVCIETSRVVRIVSVPMTVSITSARKEQIQFNEILQRGCFKLVVSALYWKSETFLCDKNHFFLLWQHATRQASGKWKVHSATCRWQEHFCGIVEYPWNISWRFLPAVAFYSTKTEIRTRTSDSKQLCGKVQETSIMQTTGRNPCNHNARWSKSTTARTRNLHSQ